MNQLQKPALEPRLIMVQLAQLDPIPHGVRKTNGVSIKALAASIAAEGLLQNLTITVDPNGPLAGAAEFQRYHVIAGNRRLRAMRSLVDQGKLLADHEVPCLLVDASQATSASLAENTVREAMHPGDEYRAFAAMVAEGKSTEDVAARFGVTPQVVQRRLKLANVAPKIFEQFLQDKVTLEQMQALAISDDHKAQEKAWFKPEQEWHRQAHKLREILTIRDIDIERDPVAQFVGVKAFEAAGGQVRRDLFGKEGAGFITHADRPLLQKLAAERLQAVGDKVAKEGWSFVRVVDHIEYSELAEYSRAEPAGVHKPDDVEKKRVKELTAERAACEKRLREINGAEYPDNDGWPDEVLEEDERLRERSSAIGDEIQALEDARSYFDPKILAKGGAIVTIDHGAIVVHRGLVKGKLRQAKDAKAEGGKPAPQKPGHSEALIRDLTAHATFAIAAELIANPGAAVIALTCQLARKCFYSFSGHYDRSLDAVVKIDFLQGAGSQRRRAEGLQIPKGNPDLAKLATEHAAIVALLPKKADELLPWLFDKNKADPKLIARILAYCVAESIDAIVVNEKDDRAATLAKAVKLNMATRWTVTPEAYLTRVNAAQIRAALADESGSKSATAVAAESMKKGDLVAYAAPILARANWLPKFLRFSTAKAPTKGEKA